MGDSSFVAGQPIIAILADDPTPRKDPLAQGRTALLGDAVRPQPRNLGAAPANEGDHWPLRGIRWVQ
ncbi:hypothetical protein ABIE37_002909 [Arthrobacter bambusae]|uniref:Uncharacterized protein n=1 Tax=Arthrobacter bambusae TaxID=1338426 RepID=A0ABV2P8L5_9MICC